MITTHMNTVDAKETFSELINRVSHQHECVILTRRGKEIAALIPIELLTDIKNAQNKQDLADAVAALKEAREQGTITLEDFNAK